MLVDSIVGLIILGIAILIGLSTTKITLIILGIAVFVILNAIGKKYYKKKYEEIKYGVKVDVNGLKMNVNIIGEKNSITLVMLPGLGMVSPVICYKPFVETLADKYRIITVEPFGYGLSDLTKEERNNKNYVSELHTCLQKLGVKKYYLMAHSIGGIYSLSYVNKYPEEVLGFIGLDNTPRNMPNKKDWKTILMILIEKIAIILNELGLFRISTKKSLTKIMLLDSSYNYSDEDKKNFDIIFRHYFLNNNVLSESRNRIQICEEVNSLNFPDNMPVIMFLASKTCEFLPTWEQLHKDMKTSHPDSEIIILEGTHNINIDQKKAISDKLKTWIK